MTAFAYAEKLSLPEDDGSGAGSAETGHAPVSAGTFALRRARYFNEAGQEPLSSAGQQQALTNPIGNDDLNAEQKMAACNLRLVVDIANRYANHGMSLFDLVREDNPGLVYALEKSEVEGRFCFSAYATQCIRQYIERAIMSQGNPPDSYQTAPASAPSFDNTLPINTGGHNGHPA